jgi:trans-aconitate 2-methyltransferase
LSWSAAQYLEFADERTRPVRDLLAAVPVAIAHNTVDVGCGPGNSTELLVARYGAAAVSGYDSSDEMIAAARARLPQVRFDVADVAHWESVGPYQVILANAVLQWVPDHAALLPKLVARLSRGGCLAVQMPDNLDSPAHRLMRAVAQEGPWARKLAAVSAERTPIPAAEWYYGVLRACCGKVDVWRTTYLHPLAGGPGALVEWFEGTGLRPFLAPLDAAERAEFLARYLAALTGAYPALADGTVLLPFPRLFMTGVR